jgi:hypothetical protein
MKTRSFAENLALSELLKLAAEKCSARDIGVLVDVLEMSVKRGISMLGKQHNVDVRYEFERLRCLSLDEKQLDDMNGVEYVDESTRKSGAAVTSQEKAVAKQEEDSLMSPATALFTYFLGTSIPQPIPPSTSTSAAQTQSANPSATEHQDNKGTEGFTSHRPAPLSISTSSTHSTGNHNAVEVAPISTCSPQTAPLSEQAEKELSLLLIQLESLQEIVAILIARFHFTYSTPSSLKFNETDSDAIVSNIRGEMKSETATEEKDAINSVMDSASRNLRIIAPHIRNPKKADSGISGLVDFHSDSGEELPMKKTLRALSEDLLNGGGVMEFIERVEGAMTGFPIDEDVVESDDELGF